jgi:hypothetical protein
MNEFIPRGYIRLTEKRDQLGPDELRAQLAAGELIACRWDGRSGHIQTVFTDVWLGYRADEFIKRGEFDDGGKFAHHHRELLLIKTPEQKAQRVPSKGKGGRPPKFDWDTFYCEIIRIANSPDGLPDKQSELEVIMLDWCSLEWGDAPGESTVRHKVSHIYQHLGKG